MNKLFKINDKDNVAVALEELKKGEIIDNIKLLDDIPAVKTNISQKNVTLLLTDTYGKTAERQQGMKFG